MKEAFGSGCMDIGFKEFFPLFRDTILGLTFLHSENFVHGNIKPGNIMKINNNSYKLSEYGEGYNLNYRYKNSKLIDFQI